MDLVAKPALEYEVKVDEAFGNNKDVKSIMVDKENKTY